MLVNFVILFIFVISYGTSQIIWPVLHYQITEESAIGTEIGNIATDAALQAKYGELFNELQYSLLSTQHVNYKSYFHIDSKTGYLVTAEKIDRERECPQKSSCNIYLDIGVLTPDRTLDVVKANLSIKDVNDNTPTFSYSVHKLQIVENSPTGSSFALPLASDPDSGSHGIKRYKLRDSSSLFKLKVHRDNNNVITKLSLILLESPDRERTNEYELILDVEDGGSPQLVGSLKILIEIEDANDNSPKFLEESYYISVLENASLGSSIVQVEATDLDSGLNGDILYSWDTQNMASSENPFDIDIKSGLITLKDPLDFESVQLYEIIVIASDLGSSTIPSTAIVTIQVEDVNDFPPQISVDAAFTSSGQVDIPENSEIGGYVAHVNVIDGDSGPAGLVTCSLSGGPFKLNLLYGSVYTIITTNVLDREVIPEYRLRVSCIDEGKPSMESYEDIKVIVLDENDHTPSFILSEYKVPLSETNNIGYTVFQLSASDSDIGENARITYSLSGSDNRLLKIDPDSGIITVAAPIDYEQNQEVTVVVHASDNGSPALSTTTYLTVSVLDTNDELPLFKQVKYEFVTFENQTVGTEIGNLSATDADSAPFNQIIYTLETPNQVDNTFEIHPVTGRIFIKKVLNREYKAKFSFYVVASNAGYPELFNKVEVIVHVADVNDNAPQLIFPSSVNNSLQIPINAPLGFEFGKVNATDVDWGLNSRLMYAFAREIEGNLFVIDSLTGALFVNTDLKKVKIMYYNLEIMVTDGGKPPKSAVGTIRVSINDSLFFISGKDDKIFGHAFSGETLTQTQTIFISLAMITLLLITILIVAIILVRRRSSKYNESQTNSAYVVAPDNSSISTDYSKSKDDKISHDLNHSYYGEKNVFDSSFRKNSYDKHPNFNIDYEVNNHNVYTDYQGSTMVHCKPNLVTENQYDKVSTHKDLLMMPRCESPMMQINQANYYTCNHGSPPMRSKEILNQEEIAVHRLLQHMADVNYEDSDTNSRASADLSNTDSGRGPSEDGERMSPSPMPNTANQTNNCTNPPSQSVCAIVPAKRVLPSHNSRKRSFNDSKTPRRNILTPHAEILSPVYSIHSDTRDTPMNNCKVITPILRKDNSTKSNQKPQNIYKEKQDNVISELKKTGPPVIPIRFHNSRNSRRKVPSLTEAVEESDGESSTSGSYVLEMNDDTIQNLKNALKSSNVGSFV